VKREREGERERAEGGRWRGWSKDFPNPLEKALQQRSQSIEVNVQCV
jgi:hypothetical protein